MTITIYGQTPSQKNNKNVGVNRHTGKMFVTSNKIVKEWQESAEWQLRGKPTFTSSKVRVDYLFYCKDNRRRDLDNMVASINDALVKAKIIDDDSWQVLTIGEAKGMYDKFEPRCEITIKSERKEVA